MDDTMILNIAVPSNKPSSSTPSKSSKEKWMEKKQNKASAQKKQRNEKRNNQQAAYKNKSGDFNTRNEQVLERSKKIQKRPMNPRFDAPKKIIPEKNQEAIMKTALNTEITQELFSAVTFSEIPNFNPKVASALEQKGFTKMTEIQKKGIPAVMQHRNCLIKSETGSGKTLAYLAPIINDLSLSDTKINRDQGTYCIVICPTRELCVQVVETAMILLKKTVNIVVGAIMGGEAINKEKARLRKGITMLVCTPGRLIYHMKNTNSFNHNSLKYLVFEESDRTLDMGFKNDLEEIIKLISQRSDYEQIQKILISANFTEKIESLWLKMSTKDCARVGFSKDNKEEENYIADCKYLIPASLSQQYCIIEERKRLTYLLSIIMFSGSAKIIIFVSTCDEVEYLEMVLQSLIYKREEEENVKLINLPIYKLHGKIEQKIRTDCYLNFKKVKEGIMLSTDVASRGLDFEDVKLIIQLDPPQSVTDYVNRMGRTARIGHKGLNLLFLGPTEVGYAKLLEAENIKIDKYEGDDYYSYVEGKVKNDFQIEVDGHTFLDQKIKEFITSEPFYKVKARRAYVSYVRSYARLKEKEVFHQKNLNLMHLAKAFGLLTPHASNKEVNERDYSMQNFQKLEKKIKGKKKRRATSSNVLEKLEFM